MTDPRITIAQHLTAIVEMSERQEASTKHHPAYMSGGGMRWCSCSCGWASALYRNAIAAQLAYGDHLKETK